MTGTGGETHRRMGASSFRPSNRNPLLEVAATGEVLAGATLLQVSLRSSVEPFEMGEVARLRPRWEAPDESMPAEREPPSFEAFFEDEKERLLRALSIIMGSRGEAEDLAQEAFTRQP